MLPWGLAKLTGHIVLIGHVDWPCFIVIIPFVLISCAKKDDSSSSTPTYTYASAASGATASGSITLGNYSISGTVIKGKGIGNPVLGYPTANLDMSSVKTILPANGIYATKCNEQSYSFAPFSN